MFMSLAQKGWGCKLLGLGEKKPGFVASLIEKPGFSSAKKRPPKGGFLVGAKGLEPPTSTM